MPVGPQRLALPCSHPDVIGTNRIFEAGGGVSEEGTHLWSQDTQRGAEHIDIGMFLPPQYIELPPRNLHNF